MLSSRFLCDQVSTRGLNVVRGSGTDERIVSDAGLRTGSRMEFCFEPLAPARCCGRNCGRSSVHCGSSGFTGVPVPIFFTFSLRGLLDLPGAGFSGRSRTNRNNALFSAPRSFTGLPFSGVCDGNCDSG